ncbi:MAG TPA: MmgE/PrpD family protein [Stellaceae bacterium]|nr:MmgE/PrpD family protein [Stellaceae bacterium]
MDEMLSSGRTIATDGLLDTLAGYAAADRPLAPATTRIAALTLMDALACAAGALAHRPALLGPLFEGTGGHGARVPATDIEADPVKAAFDTSLLIRWLDFSDTSILGGHPSDNLGAILAAAEYRSRQLVAEGRAPLVMDEVFRAIRTAYEIQGCLASNKLDGTGIGLDHVFYVKMASAAVAAKLLGGDAKVIRAALSNAVLDSQSLNAYRHVPNAGPRKGWAGADAASRGLMLAALALKGEPGYRQPLSAPIWGFEAVHLGGKPLTLGREPGDFFLDRVIFKLVPCQRNGSTAVEAAMRLHAWFAGHGFEATRIEIFTQDEAMRRIVKSGPLSNSEARDHCLQYMVAVALLTGRLSASSYGDVAASDPRIDALRDVTEVVEKAEYTRDHHDPAIASCANAIRVTAKDGAVSELIEVAYPIGDPIRRDEAAPLLAAKFDDLAASVWGEARRRSVVALFAEPARLAAMPVPDFLDQVAERPIEGDRTVSYLKS